MNPDNAYADLVAVAQQIDAEEFSPYSAFTLDQLAEFVPRHAAQLAAAREALKRPCRVEVRMVKEFYEEHWPETKSLRQLIQLFACEARLAASREDFQQVTRSGLDLLELGNAMCRGGLILDYLVGSGGSGVGVNVLRKERAKFSDEQRSRLINELLRFEAEREPIETIIARDREWEIATGYSNDETKKFEPRDPEEIGIPVELQQELYEITQAGVERERSLPPEQQRQMERSIEHTRQALVRLLVTDLALRRFQDAQRVLPNRLHLLAPKFLSAVPLDPFTNGPLIYRRHGEAFELYSTGPKRVDGSGSFGNRAMVSTLQADLCLDMDDFPEPENLLESVQKYSCG